MKQAKVSHRKVGQAMGQVIPAVNQLLQNEVVTIKKFTALEAEAAQSSAFREMSLAQRLRWLVRGMQ